MTVNLPNGTIIKLTYSVLVTTNLTPHHSSVTTGAITTAQGLVITNKFQSSQNEVKCKVTVNTETNHIHIEFQSSTELISDIQRYINLSEILEVPLVSVSYLMDVLINTQNIASKRIVIQ